MEETARKSYKVCDLFVILCIYLLFCRSLPRTSNDTLVCDESLQFQFEKNDLALTSLRFLLFCADRSGIQDLMFESIISMNPSLAPSHKQTIEFHNLPEVRLCWKKGLQYLPSFSSHSERSILI